jgi:hypothetical protein
MSAAAEEEEEEPELASLMLRASQCAACSAGRSRSVFPRRDGTPGRVFPISFGFVVLRPFALENSVIVQPRAYAICHQTPANLREAGRPAAVGAELNDGD